MLVTEAPKPDSPRTPSSALATASTVNANSVSHPDTFSRRHIGPNADEARQMLELLGCPSLDALIDAA
ncbi:MAG: hypothetical protein DME25_00505, partial [Verrucomicrobia bacterium]